MWLLGCCLPSKRRHCDVIISFIPWHVLYLSPWERVDNTQLCCVSHLNGISMKVPFSVYKLTPNIGSKYDRVSTLWMPNWWRAFWLIWFGSSIGWSDPEVPLVWHGSSLAMIRPQTSLKLHVHRWITQTKSWPEPDKLYSGSVVSGSILRTNYM